MNSDGAPISRNGPHPGILALLYTVLFCLGLYPVTALYRQPYWPGPWEPPSVIIPYFQNYGGRVLFCIVLQSGAMVCLGLFTAAVVSRLRLPGGDTFGVNIALLGGFLVVADAFAGSIAMWTMLRPGVLQDTPLVLALYYIGYGLGGPGFSAPMGLLMAGISVTAAFRKLLPVWVIVFGLLLAVAGEISWLHLAFPKIPFLIPLVRFPGFIWLISVGFLLPKARTASRKQAPETA